MDLLEKICDKFLKIITSEKLLHTLLFFVFMCFGYILGVLILNLLLCA